MSSAENMQFSNMFRVDFSMLRQKIEALEKGEWTDVSFLIGPDGEVELVHCFKSDLLVASEYFEALFRSPFTKEGPIRVKHVQPHIFKNFLLYIGTHALVDRDKMSIEDLVDLAHAADEFLLDSLNIFCQNHILQMVSVGNVWTILNRSKIESVKSTCNEVLSTMTWQCLEHESFLEASQESFLYLLQIDEMNIWCESELVDACFKLANTKPKEERDELIIAALPYLRILTIKDKREIQQELFDYLTDTEKLLFLQVSKAHNLKNCQVAFGNLCLIKQPRNFLASIDGNRKGVLIIIQEYEIVPYEKKLIACQTCHLGLSPICDVLISGIDIMSPAIEGPIYYIENNSNECRLVVENVDFIATVRVSCDGMSRVIYEQDFEINQRFNSWHYLEFDNDIFVPCEAEICITVTYDYKYSFLEISEFESERVFYDTSLFKVMCDASEATDMVEGNIHYNDSWCFMIKSVYFETMQVPHIFQC